MARINIDDELHAEKEFKRLVRNLGDEDKAIGLLYRFWREAQDYWADECKLMPKSEFIADGFSPILDAGLAEDRPEGVYALGGKDRFSWYLQKCRASKRALRARVGEPDVDSGEQSDVSGEQKPIPGQQKQDSGEPGSDSGQPAEQKTGTSVHPTSSATSTVTVTDTSSDSPERKSPHLDALIKTWEETLAAMKVPRKATEIEKQSIFRAIKNPLFGGVENIDLALYGARHEPKTESYTPSVYADASRVLEPDKRGKYKFSQFIGWGVSGRAKEAAKNQKPQSLKPVEGEAPPPEVVTQMLGQWSRGIKAIPKESA